MATSRRVVRQHEDWLNLTDAETPWFSLPALKRALPNGLDPTPSEVRAEHKARWYGDEDAESARLADDRTSYIEWLLEKVLGWEGDYLSGPEMPAELAEGVTRYDVTIVASGVYQPRTTTPVGISGNSTAGNGSTQGQRVLMFCLPTGTDPRARPAGDNWSATWVQRAALSCRFHGVPLALVTDGDHLTLVHAPEREATGWGTWRASEFATEPVLLDSFRSMLHSRRFVAVPDRDMPEALLVESAAAEHEVTDQLGSQVRRATELLVNAVSRANLDRDGTLLAGVEPHEVYEAAVTVMMRIVFLLVAEENGLLPVDNPHYQNLYSIRTLRESLQHERFDNPEALETRTTAWHRLLATSRAMHGGIHHNELTVPAYGGSLFDPDRFPFLEGRAVRSSWKTIPGTPIGVTDLDVLAILDALLVLRFRTGRAGTDTRRLSYRNVGVEQIGHIYERLLDHDAVLADHVVLGLVGKPGEEPEIGLPELEAKLIDGEDTLVPWITDKTAAKAGRRVGTPLQVRRLLSAPVDPQRRAGLIQACQGNKRLAERIQRFANLLRFDLRDRPLVFLPGAVYVTETGSRRDSGTAYTTKELADEVVEHTLAPLCYSPGPQDTSDTSRWRIRSSADILELKVCDPAVGSGAILVAACRYLADRLIEAWRSEGHPRAADTSTAADDPNRLDIVVEARRRVAERCCYGVDRNPMATEMTKLSLWLTTVARDLPFTFLDHAIKAGDSLLGIEDFDQLRYLHYDIGAGKARLTPIPGFSTGGDAVRAVDRLVGEALERRLEMHGIDTIGLTDIERKQKLHHDSEARLSALSVIADVLAGAALNVAGARDAKAALTARTETDSRVIVELVAALGTPPEGQVVDRARDRAEASLNAGRPDGAPFREPFHWPIEFPEVFDRCGARASGFDAMVGNPPFIGGQKITGTAGTDYRKHLIAWIADGTKGSADLVAYFFVKATRIARSFGLLATNTVGQGDTSKVGLTQIIDSGWRIHRGISSAPWPGDTTLEIAKVWATTQPWDSEPVLDGRPVIEIDEMLYPRSKSGWRKQPLVLNSNRAFQGSIVLGMGFTLSPEKARALITKESRNRDVLLPYLGGEDLNQSPTHTAQRWVINFFDWSRERAQQYPDCFSIIEEKVKPERQERKSNGAFKKSKSRALIYWQYGSRSPTLYRTIESFERVLAIARHTKTVQPVFLPTKQVFSEATTVFAYDDDFHFGVLTSGFHYRWAVRHGSTLETRARYTNSDVFETFPQPPYSAAVASVGMSLDARRSALMVERDLGLTDVYNLVHGPYQPFDSCIHRLRDLHVDLDTAVRDAYGWSDLNLEHGFHAVRGQGTRFTFSTLAGDEVLDRLLELNKIRYEAEVVAGLREPAKKTVAKPRMLNQSSLLGGKL